MKNSIKDTWGRSVLELHPKQPENYIARSCVYPFQGNTASQRRDLMNQFEQATIIPLYPDYPFVDSMMMADMMKYSSCIKELRGGKVKLLDKFSYQLRTVYIYLHNGIVEVYEDNNGTVVNQKAVNNMKTDLDYMEVGNEIDLNDKQNDTFYVKYPTFFNPVNGLIGYGKNILCKVDLELDNSQDSVAVSESFLDMFISRKTKAIALTLTNKKILSKYADLFPKIGDIVEEQFLCKLVSSDGDMFNLAQSSTIPAGEEDDTVVMDETSMLVSIDVYSNNPIDDPILEKYRKDLLKFRMDIYYRLNYLKQQGYKLSPNASKLHSNYAIDQFRTNHELIDHPLVVLRIDSLSRPGVGWKFSNRYGGKYTVQSVYKDGYVKDELGRNIHLSYGGMGIVNRMIPSALLEVWFSGFQEFIKVSLNNNECTIDDIIEFYKLLYYTLDLKKDFDSLKLTKDEWKTLVNNMFVPIILMPVSTKVTLKKGSIIRKYAKDKFNYRKLKLYYNGIHDTQTATIGYMYTVRLSQDPELQTSAVAFPEMDSRGLIKDDDDNKKKGLSTIKRKSSKHCVQTGHLTLNQVPDYVAYDWIVDNNNIMDAVTDHCVAIGMKLEMGDGSTF